MQALDLFAGPIRHFGDACAGAAAFEATEGQFFSFGRKLLSVPGIIRSESVTLESRHGVVPVHGRTLA